MYMLYSSVISPGCIGTPNVPSLAKQRMPPQPLRNMKNGGIHDPRNGKSASGYSAKSNQKVREGNRRGRSNLHHEGRNVVHEENTCFQWQVTKGTKAVGSVAVGRFRGGGGPGVDLARQTVHGGRVSCISSVGSKIKGKINPTTWYLVVYDQP